MLQITLQISLGYVLVFMAGKLDQLVPWIYLFTAFQLLRGLLLIEDETVDLIKQQSCVYKMFQEI